MHLHEYACTQHINKPHTYINRVEKTIGQKLLKVHKFVLIIMQVKTSINDLQ